MSYVKDARTNFLTHLARVPEGTPVGDLVDALIRETIEDCARVCERGNQDGMAAAIRELARHFEGEPDR